MKRINTLIAAAMTSALLPAGAANAEDAASYFPKLEDLQTYKANQEAMESGGLKVFDGVPVTTDKYNATVGIAAAGSDLVNCTGTLIATNLVLTARHCAYNGVSGRVFVGNIESKGDWYEVEAVVWPDDARRTGRLDDPENPDIVVLKLATSITNVTPRQIASAAQIDAAIGYRVVGFGFDEDDVIGVKNRADVPTATNDCEGFLTKPNISEASLFGCAPGAEIVAGAVGLGRDTCNGDSGGPLLLFPEGGAGVEDYVLAGATSRAARNSAQPCGDGGVYVRLTGFARAFIAEAMQ